jgi:hypothetical protein
MEWAATLCERWLPDDGAGMLFVLAQETGQLGQAIQIAGIADTVIAVLFGADPLEFEHAVADAGLNDNIHFSTCCR